MKRASLIFTALAIAACGDFESPEIVLDMRVLGVTAEPPEIVTPPDPDDIELGDLGEVEICALVADPSSSRNLSYVLGVCPPERNGRCPLDAPYVEIAFGTVEDPEEADAPISICGTLSGSLALAEIIEASIRADDLAGFGGIGVQIELSVRGEDDPEDTAEYATKEVRYSPRIPDARVANRNPTLEEITVVRAATGERGLDSVLPIGRCSDVDPVLVSPGEEIQLLPVEPEGAREDYLVPTFDGGSREFTESLTYQFYATAGSFSRFVSGGPRDFAGNEQPIDSKWTAPDDLDEIGEGLELSLWVIQRDERGGQAWYQSCARVVP